MASTPHPFAVDDNADEDFFDKLVNDDDGMDIKVTTTSSATPLPFLGGWEAKAFANLSIHEPDNKSDVNYNKSSSGNHKIVDGLNAEIEKPEHITKLEAVEERGNQLVASNSFEFDNLMHQPENEEDGGADALSDTTVVCKSSGESSPESAAPGVKEVGWNAFQADSTENGGNGFRSYSDFFTQLDGVTNEPNVAIKNDVHGVPYVENSVNFGQHNEIYKQDLNNSQQWENQYPGWKYDTGTGQWYQVDGYDATNVQTNTDSSLPSSWELANDQAEVTYLQQTATNWNQTFQVSDTTEPGTNWNQVSQVNGITKMSSDQNESSENNNGYPPHMVFFPQYPGWYYDTIAQKWQTLESYTASIQSTAQVQDQKNVGGYESSNTLYQTNVHKIHNIDDQGQIYDAKGSVGQVQDRNWAALWKPENTACSEVIPQCMENQPMEDHHGHNLSLNDHGHNFSIGKQLNDPIFNQNDQFHVSNVDYSNQNSVNFIKKNTQVAQTSYPDAGRSSAGRPAHALVTFGFGGKLILLKDNSSTEYMNFGSQNHVGDSISVLNLAEVVNHNADASNRRMGFCNYVQALCQQCLPGPLSGGSIGTKELNKWIEERITNPESADMDYKKAEVLRLLLSLLKIACQHYGKLRSPYGTDAVTKESDVPESLVASLFASAKRGCSQFSQYGAVVQCLQQTPSEGQIQVTAAEVQSLLVSGRKKEALQCAQDGQLWGAAIVLAAQLGDQFYVETVRHMALCQFAAGLPLRTLCLLIAGQPADVFSTDNTTFGRMAGVVNISQQATHFVSNPMLENWEENLAMIIANRTKDDELVLMHLGDCLWKERSDIIAAHICYLVAEAKFEPYSDTARMCLVGADHWKSPRTYASPEAIQRTEIYEYSKMLGNSQFVLLPFQPYKLIYAQMLAEVGKTSDALKYCQAVMKSLKTGRSPEVESLRPLVLSLEERIKAHQQGGFSSNLAPKKLVDKLLNLFDNTPNRAVPGIPPPPQTCIKHSNEHQQPLGPRVSTSQSAMSIPSLVPSPEPTTNPTSNSNRMTMHTRSVSEPDFGKSPRQGRGTSLFARLGFGSVLLQKTVYLLKPRQSRQANLGETSKFRYDEKLKRWVEEGANLLTEEATLPPPPTTTVFHNRTSDYNLKSVLQSEASHSSRNANSKSSSSVDHNAGIPPLPPNQYSARGRMGIRSRYVDTFHRDGGSTVNLFQSPSAPHKPTSGVNPKFFIPSPVSAVEQPVDDSLVKTQDPWACKNPTTSPSCDSFHATAPPSPMGMQRVTSWNNISNQRASANAPVPHSRRTASWSGDFNDSFSTPNRAELKPLEIGMHSSLKNGGSFQEVEL